MTVKNRQSYRAHLISQMKNRSGTIYTTSFLDVTEND